MLSRRAQNLKPSPTLALAAKAKALASEGHDVISLSVGEPDWDTFENIKASAIQAIKQGKTKYTPANGLPELRKAIAEVESPGLGVTYSPQQVTVSTGAKFILFSALQVLLEEGNEVLIPSPYWVSYPTMVELAGATPKILQTTQESHFKITPADLEKHIGPQTKMLILNSPSNPSGMMYSRQEWKDLVEVFRRHPHMLILSDDIYNRLVFNPEGLAPHFLNIAPELAERTLVVNGLSKSCSMTGWRLGWALGPEAVISAMSNYQSQSVSCAASFVQVAAIEALLHSAGSLKAAVEELKERRDFFCKGLNQLVGITAPTPDGAFYIWTNVEFYMGKSWKGRKVTSSKEFAEFLLEDQKVAVVPGIEFGTEGYVRISYALQQSRMAEALSRLQNFLKGFNPS